MTDTTDLARSNLDQLLDSYEGELPESTGTGLGTFYWYHGSNRAGAKTPGVFYVKNTEIAEAPDAPWQLDSRFEDQPEPEYGYSAALLKIAPILWHAQWYMPSEQQVGKRRGPKQWITGYEKGAQKHLDLICLVEGMPEPMVLAADGQNKCGALLDILSAYRNGLLRQATFRARKNGRKVVPPWTYWLPIANKKTGDGKTDYVKVTAPGSDDGSIVTPPALFLPPGAIDSLTVTADQFRTAAEIYTAFLAWSRDPYTFTPNAPQLTDGRNVPQEVSEDDLPF
jgi:hypothetical protein